VSKTTSDSPRRFIFPRWANYLLPLLIIGVLGGATYMPALVGLGLNPNTLNKNYRPVQPIPYSHELHVGQLGMDCTYCHTTVNQAAFAAVPPAETCLKCHHSIKTSSPKLAPLYRSVYPYLDADGVPTREAGTDETPNEINPDAGRPIEWVKVHDLADYAYFNHAAHVTKGISCVSCHGRVDRMGEEGVMQMENLSMGWCLECHREPEKHLRPAEHVTNLGWSPLDDAEVMALIAAGELDPDDEAAAQLVVGRRVHKEMQIHGQHFMQACSTCHR
jgi:hypothetical protein